MVIFQSLLIAIALAMDAFSVSIAGGSQLERIKSADALLVALYFGIFQGVMALLGWYGGKYFLELISAYDHWVAIILLIAIGGKMIWDSLESKTEKRFSLNHKVLLVLAIATSIDAMGIGLSYAALNKPIFMESMIIAVVTFFLCFCGVCLGTFLQKALQNKAGFLGGIILIGISIKVAADHGVL